MTKIKSLYKSPLNIVNSVANYINLVMLDKIPIDHAMQSAMYLNQSLNSLLSDISAKHLLTIIQNTFH
jgi:hypothetical protein